MPQTNRNWSILNWNIRGINDPNKWLALRNKIDESNVDIICIQETKMELFDAKYIKHFCPRRITQFEFLPSVGASGGLLIAWNGSLFTGEHLFHNDLALSVRFTSTLFGDSFIHSNIYGPCQGPERAQFLNWFKDIQIPTDTKWIIMGHFNYVRFPTDRNREGGNFIEMLHFNEAINALALVEIPLKGRQYTWSNMQDAPLLEKLD